MAPTARVTYAGKCRMGLFGKSEGGGAQVSVLFERDSESGIDYFGPRYYGEFPSQSQVSLGLSLQGLELKAR